PPAPIASGALGPIANRRSNLLWRTTRLFQQCGRMWSSALNTSLAVIPAKAAARLANRFEISVIMLKSELPHEAPNPVSKKAARVHHAARRRGCVAARGGCAAAGDAGDRVSQFSVAWTGCASSERIPSRSE